MVEQKQEVPVEFVVNTKAFKAFVSGVESIADSARLDISTDSVAISTMDPSGIAMVYAVIPKKFILTIPNANTYVGVDIDGLKELIADFVEDQLKVSTSPSTKTLKVSSGENFIEVKTFDHNRQETHPKVMYKEVMEVNTYMFSKALKHLSVVSDYANFSLEKTMKEKRLRLFASGDLGKVERKMTVGLPADSVSKDLNVSANIKFLTKILKTCDTTFVLSLLTEEPLRIQYTTDGAQLTYWLAPYMTS